MGVLKIIEEIELLLVEGVFVLWKYFGDITGIVNFNVVEAEWGKKYWKKERGSGMTEKEGLVWVGRFSEGCILKGS